MKKSTSVDEEAIDSLAMMFPGVHRNELTNFLEENGFDKAVDLLLQIYPQDQNSDEQDSNDQIKNEQKSNDGDYEYDYDEFDDSIQTLSDSIPLDDKNIMIKEIQKEFPAFDDDICMVFLEDSMFDVQKAKQEALITKQQMEGIDHQNNLNKLKKNYPNLSESYLSELLEAVNENYSLACSLINEPPSTKTDKKTKKKQVISEMGPVSNIPTKKKAKKFKNKPNMPLKSTEKQFACEFSEVNEKMKYEAQIVKLSEMFADKNLSRKDYEDALNLTNCDINRAATIISEKIENYQLNENVNKGNDGNNSVHRPIKSKKVRKLVQMFPQSSSSELEDVLYLSNGNLNVATEIMVNRNNGSPQSEEELLDNLLKSVPNQEQNDDDDDDDENANDDDDDDNVPIIVNTKHAYSSSSKISVNKTNRNHARPSQHGKTETKEIDLHGLTAAEAQVAVIKALDNAKYQNIGTISFITGRGQHTKGNISVLRPLVLSFCKDHGYRAHVGSNRGVVVCHLV